MKTIASERQDMLKQLIKDLDKLTNLITIEGINYLTDAKLRAYILQTIFIIEEQTNENKTCK